MNKHWLKNYEDSVPDHIYIPEIPVTHFFDDAVKMAPDRIALAYFGKHISYLHLSNLVDRFALGLQSIGVKKGDRVILALPNLPQFVISYWAILKLGAICVLVNPLLTSRELLHQILISRARIAIVLDRHLSKIDDIFSSSGLDHVIAAGIETYMPFYLTMAFQLKKQFINEKKQIYKQLPVILFRELLRESKKLKISEKPLAVDPAVLIFTGGVTGTPKAAVLSHKNLVANTIQSQCWITDLKEGNEVIVAALPFIHSYGMTACHHLAVKSKSVLLLYPRYNVKRILDDIIKYKVGIFPGVPTMYSAMIEELKKREIKSLPIRVCISGGAPLPVKVQKEFEALTGARLLEGYGLTEASPITHCSPVNGPRRENSIGVPWPNTEARITNPESGLELETGEIGELEVRGPQVMMQYWENPEETDLVKSAAGWLKTGDFAKVDEDGFFYIADRKKDIIFYGGESIYPTEIESVLCEYPGVKDAAVVGMDDDYYGQVVKAFLIVKDAEKFIIQELLEYCQTRLAKYKIPRDIEFVDRFPRNFLGKVLKRQLKENSI